MKIIKVKNLIFLVLLTSSLKAQVPILDTLSIQGHFIVKCACVKKKKAVIDIVNIKDTALVTRLYFDLIPNNDTNEIKNNDTISLNILMPQNFYYYATKYYTTNIDNVAMIVYQQEYKNRLNRIVYLDPEYFRNYYISVKCPTRIIRKKWNFLFWR